MTTGADGLGLISYYDVTNGDLKVAHCSDLVCSTATVSTLDSVGDVGKDTSVAIGADGLGLISYHDATNKRLKVAHCSNQVCSGATLTTLDSGGSQGVAPIASLVIGSDGLGLIAYVALPSVVKVAHCLDAACTTAELSAHSTSSGFSAASEGGISIAVGSDGLGLISALLTIIHCSNPACNSSSTTTLSDLGGGVKDTDVVMTSGRLPRIVWSLSFIPDLFVYACANVACTSATVSGATPNTGQRRARRLGARLGADGQVLVAFEDAGQGPLPAQPRVVHCANSGCTSGEVSVLDGPTSVSFDTLFPGLTIGSDGLGLISYYDPRNGDLRVALCGNTACTSPTLSVGSVSVTVTQEQTQPISAIFPVSLARPGADPATAVTVNFTTQDGTAKTPTDYLATSGTLTFAPDQTTKNIEVPITPSAIQRPNLTFTILLSNPTSAVISQGEGVGTIITRVPAFSVSSAELTRGASGSSPLRFPVTLSRAVRRRPACAPPRWRVEAQPRMWTTPRHPWS